MSTLDVNMTPWFEVGSSPVRKGVYRTQHIGSLGFSLGEGYSLWSGYWGNQYPTVGAALACGHYKGRQEKRWRGLTQPTDGAA